MSAGVAERYEGSQSPLALLANRLELPPITSVKEEVVFDYFGLVENPFLDSAATFLAAHTDAPLQAASRTLTSFFATAHTDCVGNIGEKSACWLTIRLSQPHDAFSVPRWHQDGRMYPYDESRENVPRSKYGVTILGPPTLLFEYTSPENLIKEKEGLEKHFPRNGVSKTEEESDEAFDQLRSWLADQFRSEKLLQLGAGQIVRFTWGREDSPFHSEPDIVSDRVFMTVLFGSENEIRAMAEWRAAPFGEPTM
ncbi:hypothetical protein DM02DRAFT_616192 [Periconia macrospinosa]|uniref:Clavaminate synthase-like protein n=1 Tax=Periconia macrospinosa TaxID=97972 RepID=A0A2V1DKW8_9PLEO|nr:hypothetical protein DM02DRAFT_616192 [Periconia macrospinosa]